MKIVKRKITELIAAEYNPRKINKVQEQDLKDSLTRFGLVDPIIININKERKNIVIGGHQRLRVWADLGNTEIDCNELDLTLDKERELNIRLNKNGGSFDDELVKEYFDYEELTEWGFTPDELFDKEETTADGLIDDDEIPEAKESKVKRGDVWKLGEHRIMCGDSTSSDDVAKLMNGEKADMVFTDPPYLMNFTGGIHADGSKSFNSKHGQIKNDKLSEKEGEEFLDNFNLIIKKYTLGAFYISFYRLGIDKFYNSLNRVGLKCRSLIIWNKGNHTLSNSDYMSKYEPIFYGWVENHNFYGGNNGMDIWDIKRTSKNNLHPTMKPIELCSKAITDGSINNNIVLDLFLGSGSTLIAAEKLNRKCYGMELDEKYCDVIIERWEQFTGLKAEKIN
jgi:DNA modification methylase|tara:strand:+ start:267 stop:1448 length:1182 start_codon:yes stop_codon:yes gene_type:complete